MILQWQKVNQILDTQRTPHILPSQVSLEKNNHVVMAPQYNSLALVDLNEIKDNQYSKYFL